MDSGLGSRQMATCVSEWFILYLEASLERRSLGVGTWPCSVSHIRQWPGQWTVKQNIKICRWYQTFAESKIRWMVHGYKKTWMMLPIGHRDDRCSSMFPNYVKSCIMVRAVLIIIIVWVVSQLMKWKVKKTWAHSVTWLKGNSSLQRSICKSKSYARFDSQTIKDRNPKTIQLYTSHWLDLISIVRNPHYYKDVILLERVKHRFTPLFSVLQSLPYEKRLNPIKLWTPEETRHRADLESCSKWWKVCRLCRGHSFSAEWKTL